jgi:hypothetical protein
VIDRRYVASADDDEFDDLDAVAYARAIALRLGVCVDVSCMVT